MKPLWKFAQHGQSRAVGIRPVPATTNKHLDDLTLIHSLHTEGVAHGPATLFLHCGSDDLRPPEYGQLGAVRPRQRERRTCRGS